MEKWAGPRSLGAMLGSVGQCRTSYPSLIKSPTYGGCKIYGQGVQVCFQVCFNTKDAGEKMIAGEKGDRTIEIKFPSNKALWKIIGSLDTIEFKETKERCMEKDEQHIQRDNIRNEDMNELSKIRGEKLRYKGGD